MARYKDSVWSLPDGNSVSNEQAQLAILMDLRDELKALNRLLSCHNAVAIPNILREIRDNTTKPKRRRRKVR